MFITNIIKKMDFGEARFSRDASLIFVTLLPYLFVIWTAGIFFTQDGPVHLYISSILNELTETDLTGNISPGVATYYETNWRIVPNLLGYMILQPLLKLFGAIVAEKIIVTLYVISLPYAIYLAARVFKANSLFAALLSLPLLNTSTLYLGFYNYSFSLVFFVLGLSIWATIETKNSISLKYLVCLGLISLLAFLSHAMGFAMLLLVCAYGSIICRFLDFRSIGFNAAAKNAWIYTLPVGLCLVPGFLLFMYFLFEESVNAAQLTQIDQALWGGNYENIPYLFLKVLKHRVISFFAGAFIFADRILLFILMLGLFLMGYAKLRGVQSIPIHLSPTKTNLAKINPIKVRKVTPLLLLFLLALYLFFPALSFNTRFIAERILPFVFLFLIIWLATETKFTPFIKILVTLVIIMNVAIPLKRIGELSKAYDKYQDFIFAEQFLEPGKTFMVFNLKNQNDITRLDFFLHEGKRLALNTGAINLKIIQARSPFPVIPIRYIKGKSPFPSIIGQKPSPYLYEIIDPYSYQRQTAVEVDYLLYWGEIEHKMPDNLKDYFKSIELHYRLIATSPGRGMMKIYQRKEPH